MPRESDSPDLVLWGPCQVTGCQPLSCEAAWWEALGLRAQPGRQESRKNERFQRVIMREAMRKLMHKDELYRRME